MKAPKKVKAEKPITDKKLAADRLSIMRSLEQEVAILKDRNAENVRQLAKAQEAVTEFRGVVATLEREKAMLQGYIERGIQEDKNSKDWSKSPGDRTFEQRVEEVVHGRSEPRTSLAFPTLQDRPAGIGESSSYQTPNERSFKPWWKF
jgi:hypothetical protein